LLQKDQIKNINLHYLDGMVVVEVELSLQMGGEKQALKNFAKTVNEAGLTVKEVAEVKVFFS
jgi:enamine deaminase RidA (YjgF/YER057c/UK114 family)